MALNERILRERLDMIRTSATRLKALGQMSAIEFSSNPDNFAIAEHHLRRALEALFDIGRHIIAKKGLGHPPDYRSIVITLGQNAIIDQPFADSILGMAGYRNRLVHGYAEITEAEMHRIISTRLNDFDTFIREIMTYTRLS